MIKGTLLGLFLITCSVFGFSRKNCNESPHICNYAGMCVSFSIGRLPSWPRCLYRITSDLDSFWESQCRSQISNPCSYPVSSSQLVSMPLPHHVGLIRLPLGVSIHHLIFVNIPFLTLPHNHQTLFFCSSRFRHRFNSHQVSNLFPFLTIKHPFQNFLHRPSRPNSCQLLASVATLPLRSEHLRSAPGFPIPKPPTAFSPPGMPSLRLHIVSSSLEFLHQYLSSPLLRQSFSLSRAIVTLTSRIRFSSSF